MCGVEQEGKQREEELGETVDLSFIWFVIKTQTFLIGKMCIHRDYYKITKFKEEKVV